jgi:hypothetical protein
MAISILFRNIDDTNLKDINRSNVTDPQATAVTFTGSIGTTFAIDIQHGVTPLSNGEATVTGASDSTTYTAFKGSDGKLMVYQYPAR